MVDLEDTIQTEKKYTNKWNKQSQKALSKEYIDTKHEKFYIIDFIKTEDRNSLIKGLKDLYTYEKIDEGERISLHFENIPDFRYPGKLIGSSWTPLGYLFNEKYVQSQLGGIIRELPDFLYSMAVTVCDYDDKYFCIVFECDIHDDYKDGNLKDTFIHKGDRIEYKKNNLIGQKQKGPGKDSTFNEKIRNVVEFLSDYIDGLYISKSSYFKKQDAVPPNIKVLSVRNINFSKFKKWSMEHYQYFEFFDVQLPACCRKDEFLISMQNTRSFGKMTTSAGLIFLYRIQQTKSKNRFSTKEGDINYNINQIIPEILPNFYVYYKTNFMVESKLPGLNEEKIQLKNNIFSKRTTASQKKGYEQNFENMISTYFRCNQLYFNEKDCLRDLQKIRTQSHYDFNFQPLWASDESASDLIKNGATALLEMEEKDLENIKLEFESLKDFDEDITNFQSTQENLKLQTKVHLLTKWIVILTIILVLSELGVLSFIASSIINFFSSLNDNTIINSTIGVAISFCRIG